METSKAPIIDEKLKADVHAAVEQTFGQMLGVEVKSSFLTFEKQSSTSHDVSGIVPLVQGKLVGTFFTTFPERTLYAILEKFYRRQFKEIDKTALLAVGELTNIIYGVFKHRLRDKGYAFGMAIPNVVAGEGHKISQDCWTLEGKFTSDIGPFQVIVTRIPEESEA